VKLGLLPNVVAWIDRSWRGFACTDKTVSLETVAPETSLRRDYVISLTDKKSVLTHIHEQ